MHSQFVTFTVHPEAMERFLDLARANAAGSRKEAGCMVFDVYRDPEAPRVILYEAFESEAALSHHRTTAHFRRFMAEIAALTQGERMRQVLVPVDVTG